MKLHKTAISKNNYNELFYSGTSGMALPFNKSQYPTEFRDKSRLHYYGSLFNSLEINSTFYKLPKNSTVNNWAESVPKDFRFTFKVPKTITHAHELDFAFNEVMDFMQVIENAGNKKGCILAQLPPSCTIAQIEPFKKLLESFNQNLKLSTWKLAIEFRHPSWYETSIYKLIKSFNASMVLHDMKNSSTQWSNPYNEIIYLRFHGPEPRYRGNYNDEFLKKIAQAIIDWNGEGKTVYAYFNNTMGAAFSNLQALNNFVQVLRK